MEGGRSRGLLQTIPSPISGALVIAEGTLESPAVIGGVGSFSAKPAAMSLCQMFLSPVDFLLDNDISQMIFIS